MFSLKSHIILGVLLTLASAFPEGAWATNADVNGEASPSGKPQPIARLPFYPETNRIRLDAHINGHKLRLLLDSGATTTVLFTTASEAVSSIERTGDAQLTFPALDSTFKGERLAPVTMDFSGHLFTAEKVVAFQDNGEVQSSLMLGYDGILGQEFFSTHALEIEPKTRTLNIYPAGTDLSKGYRSVHQLHMQGTAPHILFSSRLPWEQFSSPKVMLLDTGYPGTMVIWNETHFIKASHAAERDTLVEENTGIVTKASFRFGRVHFPGTPVFVGARAPFQTGERDGIIGGNILNKFKYAIDFKSEKMWILTRDEEGYVFVTGRLKELIIKGGENIAPREIDEALYEHPDVVEAAAFARPCKQYGERVEAAVRLNETSQATAEDLRALCEARVGRFKAPDCVHILPELPKGPSGKIQRLYLNDLLHGKAG